MPQYILDSPPVCLDAPCMLRCPHMFGCTLCMFGFPHIFGWPLYVWTAPMFACPPICLDTPHVCTQLYAWLPPMFGHPSVWLDAPHVWTPPVYLDALHMFGCLHCMFGCCQMYWWHPKV